MPRSKFDPTEVYAAGFTGSWTRRRTKIIVARARIQFYVEQVMDAGFDVYAHLKIKPGDDWQLDGFPWWCTNTSRWPAGDKWIREFCSKLQIIVRYYDDLGVDEIEETLDYNPRAFAEFRRVKRQIKDEWKARSKHCRPPNKADALLPENWRTYVGEDRREKEFLY